MTEDEIADYQDLDIEKKRLEIEKLKKENERIDIEKSKLQLEKNEIEKPWYFKQVWWGTMVTFFIGAAGIFVAFSTNIIGIQKLDRQKDELNNTIKNQKDSIKSATLVLSKLQWVVDSSCIASQKIIDSFNSVTKKMGIENSNSRSAQLLLRKEIKLLEGDKIQQKLKFQEVALTLLLRTQKRIKDINYNISSNQWGDSASYNNYAELEQLIMIRRKEMDSLSIQLSKTKVSSE